MAGYIVYAYQTPQMTGHWTEISNSNTLYSDWFDFAVPTLTGTNYGVLSAKATITMNRKNGQDLWDAQPYVNFGGPPNYSYFSCALLDVGVSNYYSPGGIVSLSPVGSWTHSIEAARLAVYIWKGPWNPQNIRSLDVTLNAGMLYIWHYQSTDDTPVTVQATKEMCGDPIFTMALTSGYGIVSGYNPASGSLASGTPMPYSGTVPISGYMATRMRYAINQYVSGNINWGGNITTSGLIRKFT